MLAFGIYSYAYPEGGALFYANTNMLHIKRSAFYGSSAQPWGGIAIGPSVRVEDNTFQDYGTFGTTYYNKVSLSEPLSWVLCAISTQTQQSFGTTRRDSCVIERNHFDEGAKWQIYVVDGATAGKPGARHQRVEVRNNSFFVPATTQGRAVNIKDADDWDVIGNHFAISWDEPAISCYGCGPGRAWSNAWRALGAADGRPNTPPGLTLKIFADMYTVAIDVRTAMGAIVQAAAPTWVTVDGGMHAAASATCDRAGKFFYNTATVTLDVCDGSTWKKFAPLP